MDITTIIGISLISAFFASYFTYIFGLKQYLKQRERDETMKIYILGGIERIIKILDQAYFNCEFNYSKAIRIIEYIGKASGHFKLEIEKEMTERLFKEMRPVIIAPESTPIYKLKVITGNNETVTNWLLEIMADYLKFHEYLHHELYLEFRHYFLEPEKISSPEAKATFLRVLTGRLNIIHKEVISNNEPLKFNLTKIKLLIDGKQPTNINKLKKIANSKEMKEILAAIEADYKERRKSKAKR